MSDSTTYSTAINPGAPPLRWDNVYEAFRQVNANFEILEAALGAAGITPINFNDIDSSIIPADNGAYVLGSITKQWKSVFTASFSEVPGNELNGLWAGNAHIKGIGYTIDLPENSTVNGQLIIDPNNVIAFKTIQVDNSESIVATESVDTLKILSGNGISMDVDSSAETLTINNNGITNITAGSGISRTIVSGTANIVNTGVVSLANVGSLGTRTSGLGIHVSSASGSPVITNTGVISISAGIGITVSADATTGDVVIQNSAPAPNSFNQIEINSDSINRLIADSSSDVLSVLSGPGISLSKNTGNDSFTISIDPVFDLKGSVFADDSSIMVDAVSRQFIGDIKGSLLASDLSVIVNSATKQFTGDLKGSVFADDSTPIINAIDSSILASSISTDELSLNSTNISLGSGSGIQTVVPTYAIFVGTNAGQSSTTSQAPIAIGTTAGNINQGDYAVAIGWQAGADSQGARSIAIGDGAADDTQGTDAVAIGRRAGRTLQGNYAIAIGYEAGLGNQSANSIILNASGSFLNGSNAGFYVNPIRVTTSAARPIVYNTSTKELFYTSTLEFINSTISTSDSSGITVDVQTTFNTDVTVENELFINNSATVSGTLNVNNLSVTGTITSTGSGTPEIFSDNEIQLTAGTRVEITSSPLRLASFTTFQRDALIASNGDLIYNTDTNKIQGYENGSWVDLV